MEISSHQIEDFYYQEVTTNFFVLKHKDKEISYSKDYGLGNDIKTGKFILDTLIGEYSFIYPDVFGIQNYYNITPNFPIKRLDGRFYYNCTASYSSRPDVNEICHLCKSIGLEPLIRRNECPIFYDWHYLYECVYHYWQNNGVYIEIDVRCFLNNHNIMNALIDNTGLLCTPHSLSGSDILEDPFRYKDYPVFFKDGKLCLKKYEQKLGMIAIYGCREYLEALFGKGKCDDKAIRSIIVYIIDHIKVFCKSNISKLFLKKMRYKFSRMGKTTLYEDTEQIMLVNEFFSYLLKKGIAI